MASTFLNISTDTNLGGNSASDSVVASQKAIKTYVDNNSGGGTSYTAGDGINITNNVISADIATSVSASSTNAQSVGAKLFYDTCGDIESAINTIRGV